MGKESKHKDYGIGDIKRWKFQRGRKGGGKRKEEGDDYRQPEGIKVPGPKMSIIGAIYGARISDKLRQEWKEQQRDDSGKARDEGRARQEEAWIQAQARLVRQYV